MPAVLVVGEALVDVVHRVDGSSEEHPGGSPANVALGLARLEHRVDLLTRIGDDDRGDAVRRHLEADGVRLVPGSVVAGGTTSTAQAHLDEAGAAQYEFDLDWQLPEAPPLDGYDALHTGSLGTALSPGAEQVAVLVDAARDGLTVSYDPNVRPRLLPDRQAAVAGIHRLVAAADVVKVSDEDLAWCRPGEDLRAVAREWLALGPALVVVTRGSKGALAVAASGEISLPAAPVTVVDTVGAGDSFMGGVLDFLAGNDLLGGRRREALRRISPTALEGLLRHAGRISAITCGRAGANPPRRAELAAP